MAVCGTCGREYLDSYGACPFCARDPAPPAPPAGRPRRRLRIALPVAGIALAAALASWLCYATWLWSAGMGKAEQVECFSEQVEAERAALAWSVTHDDQPVTDLSVVVGDQLRVMPKCPSDGVLSIAWDPRMPRVSCSVHGWHGDVP